MRYESDRARDQKSRCDRLRTTVRRDTASSANEKEEKKEEMFALIQMHNARMQTTGEANEITCNNITTPR